MTYSFFIVIDLIMDLTVKIWHKINIKYLNKPWTRVHKLGHAQKQTLLRCRITKCLRQLKIKVENLTLSYRFYIQNSIYIII